MELIINKYIIIYEPIFNNSLNKIYENYFNFKNYMN